MTPNGSQPERGDVLVASVCACVVVSIWLLLPVLAKADPALADGVPRSGDLRWWLLLMVLVCQSAVLAWRRGSPETVSAVVAAAVPMGAAIGLGAVIGLTSFALLIAVYSLATRRALAGAWPLLVVISVLVATGQAIASLSAGVPATVAVLTGVMQAVALVGSASLVAALVVARRDSRTAREDRIQALERERDALVQAAVARERTAMARELHDIAAHHLTGIAVMSAAITGQIDSDPTGAKAAVADMRQQSTAVLGDLRKLVGLLRDHDAAVAGDVVRAETLTGLSALVSGVAAAGQDVGLTTFASSDAGPLGAGIGPLAQLAAYRMVQESLANAGRHAAGHRCEVEIDDRDPATLVITVRNERGAWTAETERHRGLGLVGMQERAELTGSRLEVGPRIDGGWQVRLLTPRVDVQGT